MTAFLKVGTKSGLGGSSPGMHRGCFAGILLQVMSVIQEERAFRQAEILS